MSSTSDTSSSEELSEEHNKPSNRLVKLAGGHAAEPTSCTHKRKHTDGYLVQYGMSGEWCDTSGCYSVHGCYSGWQPTAAHTSSSFKTEWNNAPVQIISYHSLHNCHFTHM